MLLSHASIYIVDDTCIIDKSKKMSIIADQDFRDENSSSRSQIIPYLYRAIAPRRARVSPLFYACIESQTLKLAIGEDRINFSG